MFGSRTNQANSVNVWTHILSFMLSRKQLQGRVSVYFKILINQVVKKYKTGTVMQTTRPQTIPSICNILNDTCVRHACVELFYFNMNELTCDCYTTVCLKAKPGPKTFSPQL